MFQLFLFVLLILYIIEQSRVVEVYRFCSGMVLLRSKVVESIYFVVYRCLKSSWMVCPGIESCMRRCSD